MSLAERTACSVQRAAAPSRAAPLSRMLLLIVGVVVFTSCDFGIFGGPSGPGLFNVTLTAPYGPDGAAVIDLIDGVGLGVVAVDLGESFYEHAGNTTRAGWSRSSRARSSRRSTSRARPSTSPSSAATSPASSTFTARRSTTI